MMKYRALLLAATTLPFMLNGQAFAQTSESAEAADDGAGLGDIVVTAQRRAENVQKAALSIEVFSGDDLRAAGIGQADDLTNLATGVQVASSTNPLIYIRGVGDFGVLANSNAAVTFNIDGVAVARPQAVGGNFFDLERVEILKGPQGTLYGRNASGGAVNIITVAPKFGETGGFLEANIGNYGLKGVEGAINLGIGENAALRASFQVNDRDGYLSTGTDDDKRESFRLQAKVEAGAFTFRPSFSFTHLGGKGNGLVPIPSLPGRSAWTGNTDPVAGAAYIARAAANLQAALNAGCIPGPTGNCPPAPAILLDPSSFNALYFQNTKSYAASLQTDVDLGGATLTVIPAWRKTTPQYINVPSFLFNLGTTYTPSGARTKGDRSEQASIEARISGQSDQLKWVVGGIYFKEDQFTSSAVQGGLILNSLVEADLSTKALAAFGQATFSVSDKFRVTGGLRYTNDKRTATNFQKFAISPSLTAPSAITGIVPSAPCLPTVNIPPVGARVPGTLCPVINQAPGFYDSKKSFNKLTWKFGVEVDLAEQSMLFADVSRGFKAGGFSQAVSLTNGNALQSFEPETITAYTLGIKNRFLDNRLQLNAEAFYWDYGNLQTSGQAIDGTGLIVLLTQNVQKASVKGLETSVVAKPWKGGTLRGSLAYVDGQYDDYKILAAARFIPRGRVGCPVSAPNAQGLVTVDCSGFQMIRSPKWSGNVGLNQVFDLGEGNVTFDADLAFASKRFIHPDFTAAQIDGGYAIASASLTYNAPNDKWFIGGWVRNLTNTVVYTGGGGHQAGFVVGWNTSTIMPPRTYGLRAGIKF